MALIQCPECGRQVSDKAAACPGCGAPPPKPRPVYQKKDTPPLRLLLISGGIFLALIALGWLDQSEKKTTPRPTEQAARPSYNMAELERQVGVLVETGLVTKLEPQYNSVQVDPLLWATIEIDTKKGIALTLAKYCAAKKGTGTEWVDLVNNRSGKRVASWGAFGYRSRE